MNRERGVVGGNSYAKELGFNPLAFLQERCHNQTEIAWLDLCCGSGRALIEAFSYFSPQPNAGVVLRLVGVDLVGMFLPVQKNRASHVELQLLEANLSEWEPVGQFDLITCVHGLHYIGDKLRLIERVATWLKPTGNFAASFDPRSIRDETGQARHHAILKQLRANGCLYKPKRHLLTFTGQRSLRFNARYLGADENAGPNYTGQPAVNAYYQLLPL